jgi:hypothetical protein
LATALTLLAAPTLFIGLALLGESYHFGDFDGGRLVGGLFCSITGLLFAIPAAYWWYGYLRNDRS